MTPPIDMHVHLVGNGKGGSGCWLNLGATWWQRPLSAYMLRHIGIRGTSLHGGDFDEIYAAHLLEAVRDSSIGRAVLLAQDEVHDPDGRRRRDLGTFFVPNDCVLNLARQHPEFIPAVSIHPARADAIEELERCLEAGAAMLKLLPNCHNVNCSAPRFRPFWERLAAAGMPLLAHTGGEHTVQVINAAYADPRTLTLPLECGVNVIAAHAATRSGLGDPEYFHVWAGMLEKFSNLYGDTSAWHVPMRGRWAGISTRGLVSERLLHGSDFPVPCHGLWARLRGFISHANWRRCAAIENAIERDYQLKLAMGFGPEHFTRVNALLPRAAVSS